MNCITFDSWPFAISSQQPVDCGVAATISSERYDVCGVIAGYLIGGTMAETFRGTVRMPGFPDGLEWLNVERPLTTVDLRGKLVILDFWTYC